MTKQTDKPEQNRKTYKNVPSSAAQCGSGELAWLAELRCDV